MGECCYICGIIGVIIILTLIGVGIYFGIHHSNNNN
jgi:hypothetical protein